MKKIAVLAVSVVLFLGVVKPVLAVKNIATVLNSTTAIANTGITVGNTVSVDEAIVSGEVRIGGTNNVSLVSTGNASALAVGVVIANNSPLTFNKAIVGNITGAQAETGIQIGNGTSVITARTGPVLVGGTNFVTQLRTGNSHSSSFGVVIVNTQWIY